MRVKQFDVDMPKDYVALFACGGVITNPGSGVIAYSIYRPCKGKPKLLAREIKRVAKSSDNLSNLSALVAGLRRCREFTSGAVFFHTDNHTFRRCIDSGKVSKNSALLPLMKELEDLRKSFQEVLVGMVPVELVSVARKTEIMVEKALEGKKWYLRPEDDRSRVAAAAV